MTDTELATWRRIETLKAAIGTNRAFLASVPNGADPKTEAKLERDEDELADLLRAQAARTEAA